MDRDRDGFINMTDLRETMKGLGIVVSGAEFRKLWDLLDQERKKKLSFLEFSNRFANLISPDFISMPLSRRPNTPKLKEWQEDRETKAYIRKLRDIDVSSFCLEICIFCSVSGLIFPFPFCCIFFVFFLCFSHLSLC